MLTEAEREALADALKSADDGCWQGEECCQASLDAMLPAVETLVAPFREREAKVRALADEIERQSRICNVGNTATIALALRAVFDTPARGTEER